METFIDQMHGITQQCCLLKKVLGLGLGLGGISISLVAAAGGFAFTASHLEMYGQPVSCNLIGCFR
jgi:hypothetical protein